MAAKGIKLSCKTCRKLKKLVSRHRSLSDLSKEDQALFIKHAGECKVFCFWLFKQSHLAGENRKQMQSFRTGLAGIMPGVLALQRQTFGADLNHSSKKSLRDHRGPVKSRRRAGRK